MPARIKKNHRGQKSRPNGKKTQNEKAQMGSFRVIGGEWRSRRLNFPALEGLRPTTDRVKETVFNWLAPYLPGAKVLDLFAGSGSLGIEALSRDASRLVSIEKSSQAAKSLSANYSLLGITNERAKVECSDALVWLNSGIHDKEEYDMVFLDPPFRKDLLQESIDLLDSAELLSDRAVIYIELEKEGSLPSLPSDWIKLKEKVAGQVNYLLYQRQSTTRDE